MAEKQDFYVLLGLRRNASPEEIRQAHFEAARRLHPDTNQAPGETELFLKVQKAYEVLSNPQKRAQYDASLPSEKAPGGWLEQKILFSRQGLPRSDKPQTIYAMLGFSVPAGLKRHSSPPLNLCLVLDRSTSMQGHNIDVVKATAIEIMRQLKPQDLFSVVAFSDRAELIISAADNRELGKQEAHVQMMQPSGGTEIFSGLQLGYEEVTHNASHSRVNHIILLTDGRTYGDEGKCALLARQAAVRGIGISGLGIGSEWNDDFLDELASLTGGSSMYVPRPQDIRSALMDKFDQLGKAYIEETRLEFAGAEDIELRYAFRLQPEAGLLSLHSPMILGPVAWDGSLRILMEFLVQPAALQRAAVTLLNGRISAVVSDQAPVVQSIPLQLARRVHEEADATPPPAEIMQALSLLKLYRLQEQARLEVTTGNYKEAAERLSRLATHLLAQGERGLAKTALMEAENIPQRKSLSQRGGKEIKYGTRALLSSGQAQKDDDHLP